MRMFAVLAVTMAMAPAALGCVIMLCQEEPPQTPYELPLCNEYELNETLIELAKVGDRSAVELLQRRYETTIPYSERHRIAAALLGRVPDDRRYWNELEARAKDAIRFAHVDDEPPPAFVEWCQARGVDHEKYRWTLANAFLAAAPDPRARGLLREALETKDHDLFTSALVAILDLRDESFLPALERNIARFPDRTEMALWLSSFGSEAADSVALKFLGDEDREVYGELRRRVECERMNACDP